MAKDRECFLCVVEKVSQQRYDKTSEVVTSYQGTPLCAVHAMKVHKNATVFYQEEEVKKSA